MGDIKAILWNTPISLCLCFMLIFLCFSLFVKNSYKTEAIPPMEKVKTKLSISNPVVVARLNKDGGFQYSGTNNGSVNASGKVIRLAQTISFHLSACIYRTIV